MVFSQNTWYKEFNSINNSHELAYALFDIQNTLYVVGWINKDGTPGTFILSVDHDG